MPKCNNCFHSHRKLVEVCVPATLLAVSVDGRESITEAKAKDLLANIDPYAFWEDMGKIVDRLEEGFYDQRPEHEMSEDICSNCGVRIGFGVPAFHLGICEDCKDD